MIKEEVIKIWSEWNDKKLKEQKGLKCDYALGKSETINWYEKRKLKTDPENIKLLNSEVHFFSHHHA